MGVGHFDHRLSRRSEVGLGLSRSSCLGGGLLLSVGLEGFFDKTGFFAEQIFYIVAAAHAGGGYLLIEESVGHGSYANGSGGASVLSEEERLGAAFGAGLFGLGGQSQWGHAGTLANKHFNVITVGNACGSGLLFQELAAESRQVEGDRTRLFAREA